MLRRRTQFPWRGPVSSGLPALPAAADVSLALVAVAAGQAVVWGRLGSEPFYGGRAANAAVSALTLGTLAWWRRSPVAALVWYVVLFCFLQVVWPHDLPAWTGFFPLVFLTANAGYRAGNQAATFSVLLALTGFTVLTVVEPTLQTSDHYVFDAAVILLPWLAARSLAVRSQSAERLAADLRALERTQTEQQRRAVAQERARIARELHDIVAHSVSVLVIQVASGRVLLGDPSKVDLARKHLLAAEHVGREALDELRRLLGLLRQETADPRAGGSAPTPQPGLGSVPALVQSFREAGIEVGLTMDGEPGDVPPGLALTIYRTVQEGLTNALKHAPDAPVQVGIGFHPAEVRVEVRNGPAQASRQATGPGTGNGLIGVRERVALFDGTCRAGPSEAGWTLSVTLPRAAAVEVPVDRL